jgi:hypothetical protein
MVNSSSHDSREAFQLKECYELAIQHERLDMAKEVLRDKSKNQDIPLIIPPIQTDAAFPESEMQIVSEALYELTQEGLAVQEKKDLKYAHRITNLPASAEKEFVLALLSLRNGTNETYRLDALKHISTALYFSPDDPRFVAFADILRATESEGGR